MATSSTATSVNATVARPDKFGGRCNIEPLIKQFELYLTLSNTTDDGVKRSLILSYLDISVIQYLDSHMRIEYVGKLKLVAVNDELQIVYENSIRFDDDLPHYKTKDGCIRDGLSVTAPTIMWIEALDELLEKSKADGLNFNGVKSISGAAQQHGSVYWRKGASRTLNQLDPLCKLSTQLKDCFSIPFGPIWMDSSTTSQCQSLEEAVGGSAALAALTGSKAYERFTASQILKVKEQQPDVFASTERIGVVSSFATSLFCGHYAHIEISDGAGMNLMNIRTKEWSETLCQLIGGDIKRKLDSIQISETIAGSISSYFTKRFDFSENCQVVNFTGDNPGSLAGMRLREGDLCLSLGTSDVLMLWLRECPVEVSYASIFGNPVNSKEYMAILCFKNGSLVRERLRNKHANGNWDTLSEMLKSTEKGNNGNIGIYFDEMEITPTNRKGCFRYNNDGNLVTEFSPEVEIRALFEGQVMAKFIHAEKAGFQVKNDAKVLVTGGASVNRDLMQIVADVFKSNVYNVEVANSAALGSAYRSKHAVIGGSFDSVVQHIGGYHLITTPDAEAIPIYGNLLKRYMQIEEGLEIHNTI